MGYMSRAILDKFLFFLRSSFVFPLVMLIPLLSPAPEGKLPAAVAHLVSYYMNELCSLLERDRERQNLLPCFFSFPTKLYPFGVLCQTELHQRPDPRAVALAAGMGRLFVTENENEILLDRERDPELQVPSPGHVNKEVKCNVARKRERGSRCASFQLLQQVMLDGCPVIRGRERETRNEIPRISEHGHRSVQFYASL